MQKCLMMLCLTAAVAFGAEMTGWISDASCGKANAKADAASRDCAERCIKGGAAPVFVSDKDQNVYKIAGKINVMPHLRHKVKVNGSVSADTLTVESIEKAN